jgi:peptidylprolyl isomerase
MLIRSLASLLVATAFLSGCMDSVSPEEFVETPIEEVTFDPSLGIDLDEFVLEESGIWVRDDEPGEGDPIFMGQEAGVYYTAWVSTGHKFDAVSESEGPPATIVLGRPGPMDGLTFGLLGMRAGGERTVLVPPSLGFGWISLTGVPPGSWLVLSIQLVSIGGDTGS